MSGLQENIVSVLKDPSVLNYLKHLIQYNQQTKHNEQTPENQLYTNTMELFAFGNYSHYIKYKPQFVELQTEPELLLKLVRLTIISIVNEHEKLLVDVDAILEDKEYGLGQALIELDTDNKGVELVLEDVLISMVDDNIADVKIDDENRKLVINRGNVLRDSYTPALYRLKVLKEEDIPRRNLARAGEILRNWHDTKLAPVQVEFDELQKPRTPSSGTTAESENIDSKEGNNRKRKTPDQT
ncbi:uncharacterized protein RJT20DRAFT_128116 [Scheffersomyces xylosifermentans]|uniref:uncharacterized protein n=1 Tax=Scheffersomyces xylosifermentans TaxID=1304137 RepID=UPI00315D35A3